MMSALPPLLPESRKRVSALAVTKLSLDGLALVEREPFSDQRGRFERLFCLQSLQDTLGLALPVSQIHRSMTAGRGTVRGLHFQFPPYAETKIVTCLHGEVFDVAVDVRAGSPTFLHWHAQKLSGSQPRSFLIGQGFAHGFQPLTDNVEMLYFHTAPWTPEAEGRLHPQDPAIGIDWPLPVTGLSEKDASAPLVREGFDGVRL